jgi:hypothetical protein
MSDEIARFALILRVLLASVGLPMFIVGVTGNLLNVLAFVCCPQLDVAWPLLLKNDIVVQHVKRKNINTHLNLYHNLLKMKTSEVK